MTKHKSPLFISYYTINTGYELEVENLKKSLKKFNLNSRIAGIRSQGSWQSNTQYKVKFIKECLDRFKQPLVFVDADAVIESEPVLFNELIEYDIGVHYRYINAVCSKLLSGTVFINNTKLAREVLNYWERYNEKFHSQLEQCNLSLAIEEVMNKGLRLKELPAEYCNIFDLMNVKDPVITHYQASRRFKR